MLARIRIIELIETDNTEGNKMIATYEQALAAIGTLSADAEFPDANMTIIPTNNFINYAACIDNRIERVLLDRAAVITFE